MTLPLRFFSALIAYGLHFSISNNIKFQIRNSRRGARDQARQSDYSRRKEESYEVEADRPGEGWGVTRGRGGGRGERRRAEEGERSQEQREQTG